MLYKKPHLIWRKLKEHYGHVKMKPHDAVECLSVTGSYVTNQQFYDSDYRLIPTMSFLCKYSLASFVHICNVMCPTDL